MSGQCTRGPELGGRERKGTEREGERERERERERGRGREREGKTKERDRERQTGRESARVTQRIRQSVLPCACFHEINQFVLPNKTHIVEPCVFLLGGSVVAPGVELGRSIDLRRCHMSPSVLDPPAAATWIRPDWIDRRRVPESESGDPSAPPVADDGLVWLTAHGPCSCGPSPHPCRDRSRGRPPKKNSGTDTGERGGSYQGSDPGLRTLQGGSKGLRSVQGHIPESGVWHPSRAGPANFGCSNFIKICCSGSRGGCWCLPPRRGKSWKNGVLSLKV